MPTCKVDLTGTATFRPQSHVTRSRLVGYLTLGLTFAMLIGTVGLIASGEVKVIGFPASEGNTIEARLTLTSGIPQSRTKETVEQL